MSKKILIVGGVAGGATTAARLRRLDETSEIIMFERGEYISFANCGLPYYIGEVIQERGKLLVQTVEGMSKKFNIDIRNLSEVTKINRENKTISVTNLKTSETYEESYDVLVLSPGAQPIKPPIPGIEEADNIFTLRNIPDTDNIKAYVDEKALKTAVVIGGGFIGIEMAENLRERGLDVTIVEMADQVMAPIDFEMATIVHHHLEEKGVKLVLQDGVQSFANQGKNVILSSGLELDSDIIILAIGVAPENKLAKEAGLELGQRGAIRVNEHLQTNDPSIFAIGDAIEVKDYVNGTPTVIPLAWPANRQGRVVADFINGRDVKYNGTMGTSIVKVFDLTVAATGNSEKTLKRISQSYEAVHIHPSSHAGYYPGAFPISLKLLFDPQTGKVLGAQAVGIDGVDKRIDVIATAIKAGLTVFDLQDLELAYAPPFSSAKDPVNMAGYVASNVIEGLTKNIQWHETHDLVNAGAFLVDVREPVEVQMGTIDGSINIPLGQIRDRLDEFPKDQPIYVFCQVGLRGYLAARILLQHGYDVRNLDGGYKTYSTVFKKKGINQSINTEIGDVSTEELAATKQPTTIKLDASGLMCPGPIMKVYEAIDEMEEGEILEVHANDPGFAKDIEVWCQSTCNTLIKSTFEENIFKVWIQKGLTETSDCKKKLNNDDNDKDGATLVVFSGDLDKAIASFIIACGAASMGKKVSMFFTFWGLNILRANHAPSVEKDTMEKMFSKMMPKGAAELPLSKMNMGGIGAKMIQHAMERKNVDDIETLLFNAQKAGVKFIACSMSMDIMGIKKEELIDGVEIGGVATYLGDADKSGLNLFI